MNPLNKKIVELLAKDYDRLDLRLSKLKERNSGVKRAGKFFGLYSSAERSIVEFFITLLADPGASFIILWKRKESETTTISYIGYKLYVKKLKLSCAGIFTSLIFISTLVPYMMSAQSFMQNEVHIKEAGKTILSGVPYFEDSSAPNAQILFSEDETENPPPLEGSGSKDADIPEASDIKINPIYDDTAKVAWNTNVPSTSEVEYGENENELTLYGSKELIKKHKVDIQSLQKGKRYVARVNATTTDGKNIKTNFLEFTAGTDNIPPSIEGVDIKTFLQNGKRVKAVISWKTDEPTKNMIYYDKQIVRGRNLNYSYNLQEEYSEIHTAALDDFELGTPYQMRIEAVDESENKAVSEDIAFLTPSPEKNIIDIIINGLVNP